MGGGAAGTVWEGGGGQPRRPTPSPPPQIGAVNSTLYVTSGCADTVTACFAGAGVQAGVARNRQTYLPVAGNMSLLVREGYLSCDLPIVAGRTTPGAGAGEPGRWVAWVGGRVMDGRGVCGRLWGGRRVVRWRLGCRLSGGRRSAARAAAHEGPPPTKAGPPPPTAPSRWLRLLVRPGLGDGVHGGLGHAACAPRVAARPPAALPV